MLPLDALNPFHELIFPKSVSVILSVSKYTYFHLVVSHHTESRARDELRDTIQRYYTFSYRYTHLEIVRFILLFSLVVYFVIFGLGCRTLKSDEINCGTS